MARLAEALSGLLDRPMKVKRRGPECRRKLEARQGPVEILIVEHAERPSQN